MTLFQTLGVDFAATPAMLINAPDDVLALLGRTKPRPAFASSLLTAEPTAVMIWWPNEGDLTLATLKRWQWMLTSADGYGWLVLDGEEGPAPDAARIALVEAGLSLGPFYAVPGGTAVAVRG